MTLTNYYKEAENLFKLIPKPNDTQPDEIRHQLIELVEDYQVPLDDARHSILKSKLDKYGLHSDGISVDDPELRCLYNSVIDDLDESQTSMPPETESHYPHGRQLDDGVQLDDAAENFVAEVYEHPSEVTLDEYQHLFTVDSVSARRKAFEAALKISKQNPTGLKPIIDELKMALDDTNEQVRAYATATLGNIVTVAPNVGLNEITQFERLIAEDHEIVKTHAAYCLASVAEEYQSPLLRCVDPVFEHIQDQEGAFQSNCVYFLMRIAEEYPERFTEEVSNIARLLNTDNKQVQVGALDLLIELSQSYPQDVLPLVDDIVSVMQEGDEEIFQQACFCLLYICEDCPEELRPHTETFEAAVEDCGGSGQALIQGLVERVNEADGDTEVEENADTDPFKETIADNDNRDIEETTYLESPPSTDFTDVAGMVDLKERLRERVINPLEQSEKYDNYGIGVEKGILLFGPPGTGKTYISRALAGELNINWAKVKGTDIISKWVGEGTENISQLFAEARQYQPCMVFIDEIDALSPERDSSNQTHNQMAMVNALLEEVSEINDQDHDVIVVAATNREDQIDSAMLRSGRLSNKIEVPPPDKQTRRQIFNHHLEAPRAVDLDLDAVGEQTVGLTAADMEQVATNAARNALQRNGRVTLDDVQTAINAVTDGKRSVSSFVSTPPELDFSEVAGMDSVKTELYEQVIDPIQNPEVNEKYGLSVSNGVLLHGPAGTGKTYVSKALAGELGINFANITVTDLLSKYAGEGPQNIETLFKEARQYAPCLVFIDEIDALTPQRRGSQQTQSQTNMVNTFLEELTTIEEEDQDVVVVGATNRIEQIDTAMLRSGRLSTKIHVPVPDATTRCEILDYHLNAPQSPEVELDSIIEDTDGLTAADMKEVAIQAARSAKNNERDVTNEDLHTAVCSINKNNHGHDDTLSGANPPHVPNSHSPSEIQYE